VVRRSGPHAQYPYCEGRYAALIDIAQDLFLRDLHERGSLDALVCKGGASLGKL